jgi:hypothetical protein
MTSAILVSELIEARDDKHLLRFQKQLASYELLIVDELGYATCRSKNEPRSLAQKSSPVLCSIASPTTSHPGDERRRLSPQAKPPQEDSTLPPLTRHAGERPL